MAEIRHVPGGGEIFIVLDDEDFQRGAWREFMDRIKSLDGWKYDASTRRWYVPEEFFDTVCEWKQELLVQEDPRQGRLF